MRPPDDPLLVDWLKSWGTYIVAGLTAFTTFVMTKFAAMAADARRDGEMESKFVGLQEDVEGLKQTVAGLDIRLDKMTAAHADLRVSVAELPKRSEQQAQFDRLTSELRALQR